MSWLRSLEAMDACGEAMDFALRFDSLQTAWEQCPQGDWMLWLLGMCARGKDDLTQLVLAAAGCARFALRCVPGGDHRPRAAILTAERWARGEATEQEVRYAARRALEAADAVYPLSPSRQAAAAQAAAEAAYAVVDIIPVQGDLLEARDLYSALSASNAATAAARARAGSSSENPRLWRACRENVLSGCAELVRQRFPLAPPLPKIEEVKE